MGHKLRTDLSLINDPKAKLHPGYASFVQTMEGRVYGYEPVNDAWVWFKTGWDNAALLIRGRR